MFLTAFFLIAKKVFLPTNEWINKCNIFTMEYYLTSKRNVSTDKCYSMRNLENTTLRQTRNKRSHII